MQRNTVIVPGVILAGLALLPSGGCYYMQAVGGQLELMRKREPIAEVLEDPALPGGLRDKLELVLDARRFATRELELPDNGSYRSYADLERDFVVWNVFATPEFAFEPRTWCFPVVGCVAYRGYFSEPGARKLAERLEGDGFDVYVGGVPAYSTLGRFDDPVLNTMIRWPDVNLVGTLFHELAHQRLFIRDDTGFNESFASAVAEIGLERWARRYPDTIDLAEYRRRESLRAGMTELAAAARRDLEALYASAEDAATKRRLKQVRLDRLAADARDFADSRGYPGSGWLTPPLNNARLLSVMLYRDHVPAFVRLFEDCDERFACFYAEAERIAAMAPVDRSAALDALAAASRPPPSAPTSVD